MCKCHTKEQGAGRCVTGQCACIRRGEKCTKQCHRGKYCTNHPLGAKDFRLAGTLKEVEILISRLDKEGLEQLKECLDRVKL